MEYFNKALKDKKVVPFKHIKILLTGSSAAGKSSFCRLLLRLDFCPVYNSTDIMESNRAVSLTELSKNEKEDEKQNKEQDEKQAINVLSYSMVKNKEKGHITWYELNPNHQIQFFRSLLKSEKFCDQKVLQHPCKHQDSSKYNENNNCYNVDDKDDDHNSKDNNNDTDYNDDGYNNKDDHNDNGHTHDFSDNNNYGDDNKNKKGRLNVNNYNEDNSNNDKSKKHITERIAECESIPDNLEIGTVTLITILDSGGQPEYIHLLPAINSYPTLTFIVHDLTKSLDDPVKVCYKRDNFEAPVQFLNYSNLDMIHLLMCFVNDSSERLKTKGIEKLIPLSKYSFIGFVGTHYDKVPVTCKQAVVDIVNKKLSNTIDQLNSDHVIVLKNEIYEVDNTTAGKSETEDKNVGIIRGKIEKDIADKIEPSTLPITWMILQLEIQELCTTHQKRYITYEDYLKMAKKNAPSCDENEIKSSLVYFNFIGTLLYFEDLSLCDYIIINLQWLYTSLAKVMHLSSENVSFCDGKLEEKFTSHRLLAKHDNCKIELEGINNQELKYFFNLLVHLKVIATVKIKSTEFYYIPCVQSSLKMCNDRHKHLLSEPLLVQFTSGFIPRGFFCSLVVHLLTDPPKRWKHQLDNTEQNYSDLIIFCLPDCTYLYVHDKIFYLKIEVRHGRKNFNPSYHSEIFIELRKYLLRVCDNLHFNSERLQYGFLCLADENKADHIAVINIQGARPTELECSRRCFCATVLDESHYIWFNEVSTYISVYHL